MHIVSKCGAVATQSSRTTLNVRITAAAAAENCSLGLL